MPAHPEPQHSLARMRQLSGCHRARAAWQPPGPGGLGIQNSAAAVAPERLSYGHPTLLVFFIWYWRSWVQFLFFFHFPCSIFRCVMSAGGHLKTSFLGDHDPGILWSANLCDCFFFFFFYLNVSISDRVISLFFY